MTKLCTVHTIISVILIRKPKLSKFLISKTFCKNQPFSLTPLLGRTQSAWSAFAASKETSFSKMKFGVRSTFDELHIEDFKIAFSKKEERKFRIVIFDFVLCTNTFYFRL